MARQYVTRDPADPTFPHGTPRGRRRGCTCDACRRAMYRSDTQNSLARMSGRTVDNAIVDGTRARAHLEGLLAGLPCVSNQAVGRAVGMTGAGVAYLRHNPKAQLRACNARALLGLTVESLMRQAGLVPCGPYARKVRQMQALGYPLVWQAGRLGYNGRHGLAPRFLYTGDRVLGITRKVGDRVDALAAEIGNRPASTADGLTGYAIRRAKDAAAAWGAYPPAFYDEAGDLDVRSIPGHPWAVADDRAARRLDLARLLLTGKTAPEVARLHGCTERSVVRMIGRLGVQLDNPGRQDMLADLEAVIDAYDEGEGDPVEIALRLGILAAEQIPRDHPGLQAWKADRRAARRLPAVDADAA